MISDTMYEKMNHQTTFEYYSAYLYLGMAAWCDANDLAGFGHWLKIQAQEEMCHGQIFYNYLTDQDRQFKPGPFEQPPSDYDSVVAVFEAGLKHEREVVTRNIHELMDIAIDERDHATSQFLQWFIEEQVEEEASFSEVLGKLKFTDRPDAPGLLMLDKDMASRVMGVPSPLAGDSAVGGGGA